MHLAGVQKIKRTNKDIIPEAVNQTTKYENLLLSSFVANSIKMILTGCSCFVFELYVIVRK